MKLDITLYMKSCSQDIIIFFYLNINFIKYIVVGICNLVKNFLISEKLEKKSK